MRLERRAPANVDWSREGADFVGQCDSRLQRWRCDGDLALRVEPRA